MKRTSTFSNSLLGQSNITFSSYAEDQKLQNCGFSDCNTTLITLTQAKPVLVSEYLLLLKKSQPIGTNFASDLVNSTPSNCSALISSEHSPSSEYYQLNIQQMNLFTYLTRAASFFVRPHVGKFMNTVHSFYNMVLNTAFDLNAFGGFTPNQNSVLSNKGNLFSFGRTLNGYFSTLRFTLALLFLTIFTVFGAKAGLPDLSLTNSVSNANPSPGDVITYTIKLKNSNPDKATNVIVKDSLPSTVSFVSANPVSGVGTYNSTTQRWTIGQVAGNSEIILEVKVRVKDGDAGRGVAYSSAEVIQQGEADSDSTPNNHNLNEDDQAAVCFSVPIYFYTGNLFTLSVPRGYTNVVWTKKVGELGVSVPITSATAGVYVKNDSLFIEGGITQYTEFAFTAMNATCPISGCCPVKFLPGAMGSIGDLVWRDDNGNGVKDSAEPGIAGVKVDLYSSTNTFIKTVTTNASGIYTFDSLQSGTYQVRVTAPTKSQFTKANQGTDDKLDSDFDFLGRSHLITINVNLAVTDTLRNNPHVDAGIIPLGSIGDYVFNDNNKDGIQNTGDTPVAGLKVILLDKNGNEISSTNTDNNGKYEFIVPSGEYYVKFDKPAGSSFTQTGKGTPSTDSDAGADGKSSLIVIDATKPVNDPARDNKDIDAGIIPVCNVGAGTLLASGGGTPLCLPTGGSLTLTATVGTSPVVPAGFSIKYLLTKGSNLVIQQTANSPSFSVNAADTYKIHTIVYNATELNLPTYIFNGVTRLSDLQATITTLGTCAAVDVTGASFNINSNPAAPTVSGSTICAGENVSLTASGGTSFSWYTLPTGGTAFASTSTVQVTPTQTTNYYVESTSNGCVSSRTSVTVTVNPKPAQPTVLASLTNACSPVAKTTANLNDALKSTASTTNGVFEWRTGNSPSSALVIDPSSVVAGTYYVFEKSTSNCYSVAGVVTVTITNCDCPNPASVQLASLVSQCSGTFTQLQLGATLGGGATSGTWTTNGTGTFDNANSLTAKYTPTVADENRGSIEFTFTTNDPDGSATACSAISAKTIFTYKAKPAAPTVSGSTICAGDNVSLTASGGTSFSWYTLPTGGTAFASTSTVQVTPTQTTNYYVESTSNGCVSSRTSVTVTVNPKPAQPTVLASLTNACSPVAKTTANLNDALKSTVSTTNGVFEWRTGNSPSSALVIDPSSVVAGTYYVFEKSTSNCYSVAGVVTVTITNCDCPNPASVQLASLVSQCSGTFTQLQLGATLGGGATSGTWTTNGTGTFDNANSLTAKYTPTVADENRGSIEFTFTTNDPDGSATACSAISAKTIFTYKAKPAAPTNLFALAKICLGESNKLTAASPGNTIKWYTTSSGGTALGTATDAGFVVTPNNIGTYTYYAEATNSEGCTSNRVSISFLVEQCATELADLTVLKTVVESPTSPSAPSYLLGQKITYSIVAKNISTVNATEVKVKDILPSSLTFVSASLPEFSNTTGEWTIGSLAAGAQKTLTIEATINKVGSIVNEAKVSGANEDPTKLANNSSTITINAIDLADLSLVKTVLNSTPNLNEVIDYKIVVANAGPNAATNVAIQDVLPAGLEFVSSTTLTNNAGTLTGTIAKIEKDAKVEFTFKAKVTTVGKIINAAQITKSDTKDPDSTPGNGTDKNEDDDDSVEINSSNACNIAAPVLAFSKTQLCAGDVLTITATGCTNGNIVLQPTGESKAGGSNAVFTVSPTLTTSYFAYCQEGSCKSPQSVATTVNVTNIVSPTLTASTSKICLGESTTLTATGCTGGTIEWQTTAKETAASITVSPSITTTYKAVCKQASCTSALASIDIVVTPKPTSPVVEADKSSICAGQSVVLTAINCNGNIKWNSGETTATITVTPTATTSYTATCTVNGCTSVVSTPVSVTVAPIVTPDVTASTTGICGAGSATLTATGCTSGTVKWYGGAQVLTGSTITVTPTITTIYTATCTQGACESPRSKALTITIGTPAPPAISPALTATCLGGSVVLKASGCTGGTILWSNGATGAEITVSPTTNTVYTAICKQGTCESVVSNTASVTVSDFAKPSIAANKTNICLGESVTLTATGCNGTVKWSDGQTGASVTVKPTTNTNYTATCESSSCKSDVSNAVAIRVNTNINAPIIVCGDEEICTGQEVLFIALGCTNGTVKWSDGQTGANITVKPSLTTTYSATCSSGTCESPKSNEKIIVVKPTVALALTALADKSNICTGAEVTLTATGCIGGNVTWTGGLTGASIKVKPLVSTTYTAVCTDVPCATDAKASVTVNVASDITKPTIIASTTSTICAGSEVTLTASNCALGVLWSTGDSTKAITVKPTVTTTYTVQCRATGCGDVSAKTSDPLTVNVGVGGSPTITASTTTICAGGQVTLTATGCTGNIVWSNGKTTATIVETLTATTTYSATCKGSTCTGGESNKITVTVAPAPVPIINKVCVCPGDLLCPGSAMTLVAEGCEGGTYKWSDGFVGAIHTIAPIVTTSYTVKCAIGTCESVASAVTTINVGTPSAPVISSNLTAACASSAITLTAKECAATVIWSNGQIGTSITVTPTVTTTYTAICKLDKCESKNSNEVTITIGTSASKPLTQNLVNSCPQTTVNLASGVLSTVSNGGVFEFHTGNTIASALVTNPSAVATTGTYYVFEKLSSGCISLPATINVFINPDCSTRDCSQSPATVTAGADASVCDTKSYKLNGAFAGAASNIVWKSTGTGTFDNPLLPSATYTASLADITAGKVKLYLTSNDPDGTGPCVAAIDTMVLTINGVGIKPVINVNGDLNACAADSITLTAIAGYQYKWYKVGSTTPVSTARIIKVKGSGSYYYTVSNTTGCNSMPSDTATVNPVATDITAPVVTSIKIGAGQTTDLTKLVQSTTPQGATLVFKLGNTPTSSDVPSPTTAGLGTYFVYYKTAQGCFSKSSIITVGLDGPIVLDLADAAVVITTNKAIYAVGDTVTTTITITNKGPKTAKNISTTTTIPGTITYVSQTGGLTLSGNTLKGVLDSLVINGTKVYTYKSVVKSPAETTVTASIVTGSVDPEAFNNKSSAVFNKGVVDPKVADVAIAMTTDKSTAPIDGLVTFKITLTNNGPATAKDLSVLSAIPLALEYVSANGLTKDGNYLKASFDSLQKGASKEFTYVAKVKVIQAVTATSSVTSSLDPNPTNDEASATIQGGIGTDDSADLVVSLSASKYLIAKNDEVTFTVKVQNKGPKSSSNIELRSLLSKSLSYISGGLTQSADSLKWVIASLASGASDSITYRVKVLKDTTITSTIATTKYSTIDPVLTNNSATVTLVSALDTAYADLSVSKTTLTTTVLKDTEVTYTIKLTNNGAGNATNVVLKDFLVSNLRYISGDFTSFGKTTAGDSLKIDVPSIGKGETKTFTYKAKAITEGKAVNTVIVTKSSKPDVATSNNTSTVTVDIVKDINVACKLGLALAVIDTAKVSDGVYNVTYQLIAKNACRDTLRNISLIDSIGNTFKSPVTFTIKSKPNVNAGSNLIVNDAFGKDDPNLVKTGSFMVPNRVDTLKYTVTLTLGGNKGPFYSQVDGKGTQPNGTVLTAKSSAGTNVDAAPSKTVLRFDLPPTLIGIAKEVVLSGVKRDSAYHWTVPYIIRVVNMGSNRITKLSVVDDLDAVFTSKGATILGKPTVSVARPGVTVNTKYTGSGLNIDLLIPDSSALVVGDTAEISLVVRVNTTAATDTVFSNVAIGVGTGSDLVTSRDVSTDGKNPDANGDKDPRNDNVATSVTLKDPATPVTGGVIGLALSAGKPELQVADSTYNVKFKLLARNYGTDTLKNVILANNIASNIGTQVTSWKLVGKPTLINGKVTMDTLFNGITDTTITKVGERLLLAKGDSVVIEYTLNIRKPLSDTIYTQASARARTLADSSVFDLSTAGTNPDTNGDGNPSEKAKTPVIFDASAVSDELFIPEGFSPNGDGNNDKFVIQPLKDEERIEFKVYNRWGSLVYASSDYKNDWGGESNQGVKVVGQGEGLPDGTYFYSFTRYNRTTGVVIPSKGKTTVVRYFTIAR